MIKILIVSILSFAAYFASAQNLTIYRSDKSVEETTQKLVETIKEKGLIFFETVSHDEIARERGIQISATRSVLFEDPDLTTTLINCQQTAALDLPLEILVWEVGGDVYIGFMDPKFMIKRFMITECDETIEALTKLMVRVSMDTLRQL